MSNPTNKIDFASFKATMEATGLNLNHGAVVEMALNSGQVDAATIPTGATVELVSYQSKNAKSPSLYASVKTSVQGKSAKGHYGRLSVLKQDAAKMRATLPVLDALIGALQDGAETVDFPEGWTTTGENDAGFDTDKS